MKLDSTLYRALLPLCAALDVQIARRALLVSPKGLEGAPVHLAALVEAVIRNESATAKQELAALLASPDMLASSGNSQFGSSASSSISETEEDGVRYWLPSSTDGVSALELLREAFRAPLEPGKAPHQRHDLAFAVLRFLSAQNLMTKELGLPAPRALVTTREWPPSGQKRLQHLLRRETIGWSDILALASLDSQPFVSLPPETIKAQLQTAFPTAGTVLLSHPLLSQPFERAVIVLLGHDEEGTLGACLSHQKVSSVTNEAPERTAGGGSAVLEPRARGPLPVDPLLELRRLLQGPAAVADERNDLVANSMLPLYLRYPVKKQPGRERGRRGRPVSSFIASTGHFGVGSRSSGARRSLSLSNVVSKRPLQYRRIQSGEGEELWQLHRRSSSSSSSFYRFPRSRWFGAADLRSVARLHYLKLRQVYQAADRNNDAADEEAELGLFYPAVAEAFASGAGSTSRWARPPVVHDAARIPLVGIAKEKRNANAVAAGSPVSLPKEVEEKARSDKERLSRLVDKFRSNGIKPFAAASTTTDAAAPGASTANETTTTPESFKARLLEATSEASLGKLLGNHPVLVALSMSYLAKSSKSSNNRSEASSREDGDGHVLPLSLRRQDEREILTEIEKNKSDKGAESAVSRPEMETTNILAIVVPVAERDFWQSEDDEDEEAEEDGDYAVLGNRHKDEDGGDDDDEENESRFARGDDGDDGSDDEEDEDDEQRPRIVVRPVLVTTRSSKTSGKAQRKAPPAPAPASFSGIEEEAKEMRSAFYRSFMQAGISPSQARKLAESLGIRLPPELAPPSSSFSSHFSTLPLTSAAAALGHVGGNRQGQQEGRGLEGSGTEVGSGREGDSEESDEEYEEEEDEADPRADALRKDLLGELKKSVSTKLREAKTAAAAASRANAIERRKALQAASAAWPAAVTPSGTASSDSRSEGLGRKKRGRHNGRQQAAAASSTAATTGDGKAGAASVADGGGGGGGGGASASSAFARLRKIRQVHNCIRDEFDIDVAGPFSFIPGEDNTSSSSLSSSSLPAAGSPATKLLVVRVPLMPAMTSAADSVSFLSSASALDKVERSARPSRQMQRTPGDVGSPVPTSQRHGRKRLRPKSVRASARTGPVGSSLPKIAHEEGLSASPASPSVTSASSASSTPSPSLAGVFSGLTDRLGGVAGALLSSVSPAAEKLATLMTPSSSSPLGASASARASYDSSSGAIPASACNSVAALEAQLHTYRLLHPLPSKGPAPAANATSSQEEEPGYTRGAEFRSPKRVARLKAVSADRIGTLALGLAKPPKEQRPPSSGPHDSGSVVILPPPVLPGALPSSGIAKDHLRTVGAGWNRPRFYKSGQQKGALAEASWLDELEEEFDDDNNDVEATEAGGSKNKENNFAFTTAVAELAKGIAEGSSHTSTLVEDSRRKDSEGSRLRRRPQGPCTWLDAWALPPPPPGSPDAAVVPPSGALVVELEEAAGFLCFSVEKSSPTQDRASAPSFRLVVDLFGPISRCSYASQPTVKQIARRLLQGLGTVKDDVARAVDASVTSTATAPGDGNRRHERLPPPGPLEEICRHWLHFITASQGCEPIAPLCSVEGGPVIGFSGVLSREPLPGSIASVGRDGEQIYLAPLPSLPSATLSSAPSLVVDGFSRWEKGQLEDELKEGSWVQVQVTSLKELVAAAVDDASVASSPPLWERLMTQLGPAHRALAQQIPARIPEAASGKLDAGVRHQLALQKVAAAWRSGTGTGSAMMK